jgi:tricorn protease-like protein
VNTEGGVEYSPYVSPDGEYFFFMSSRMRPADERAEDRLTYAVLEQRHNQPRNGNSDIYWIDAGFIEELRPE